MTMPTKIEISTGTLLKIVVIAVAVWFMYLIKEVIAILFVAIILASAIDPFIEWCAKRSIPRLLGVVIVYIVLLTFVGLIVVLLIPPVTHQLQQLTTNVPLYWERLSQDITALKGTTTYLPESLREVIANFQSSASSSGRGLVTAATNFFGGVASAVLVLVIMFYLLIEEQAIKRTLQYLAPAHYQPYLTRLLFKIRDKIGLWLRGQLVLSGMIGLTVFIVMTAFGYFVHPLFGQYALVLALIAFLFEFIPYIGPVVAAIPALIIGLSQSLAAAMAALVFYLIMQWLENHVLVPQVMRRAVGLNPIIVIIAMMIGAQIGHVVGVILAIPVTTALTVVVDDIFETMAERDLQNQNLES